MTRLDVKFAGITETKDSRHAVFKASQSYGLSHVDIKVKVLSSAEHNSLEDIIADGTEKAYEAIQSVIND